jgi:DNA-binding XRE family transcriptional regulator
MTTMARTLKEKMATLDPARRASVEAEADRLHTEYLTLQELRKAKEMTQVQLAKTLGIQQATVAKYERQSDLLLSTLTSYVEAMGGNLKLMVEFCPSSDNSGHQRCFPFGGSGSSLIEIMRFQFGGASAA